MSKKKNKANKKENKLIIKQVPGFSLQFKEDLQWWFRTDPKKAGKILDLITEVMKEPFQGIGKPEPLKYMDANIWSRRIDLEHRLIYRVGQGQIDFLSCRFHYD